MPTIAAIDDGTVGAIYYDLRHASPSELAIATDVWLVWCRRDCASASAWEERHISGPFDLERAPFARGYFLGDYQGLVGAASGFRALIAVVSPPGAATVSHAEFVSVTLT